MSDFTSSVGFGLGMGVFSSVFAMAGFTVMRQALAMCDANPGMAVFMCIFSLPFLGVPLIMYFTMQNIVIPITAYCILTIAQCWVEYKKRKNAAAGSTLFNKTRAAPVGAAAAVPAAVPVAVPAAAVGNYNSNAATVVYSNYQIKSWLDSIGMIEYYSNFVNNGYETVNDMNTLTKTDCNNIGIIKYLHVKKIVDKAKRGNEGPVMPTAALSSEGAVRPEIDYNQAMSAPSAPGDELPAYGATYQ